AVEAAFSTPTDAGAALPQVWGILKDLSPMLPKTLGNESPHPLISRTWNLHIALACIDYHLPRSATGYLDEGIARHVEQGIELAWYMHHALARTWQDDHETLNALARLLPHAAEVIDLSQLGAAAIVRAARSEPL